MDDRIRYLACEREREKSSAVATIIVERALSQEPAFVQLRLVGGGPSPHHPLFLILSRRVIVRRRLRSHMGGTFADLLMVL